MKIRRISLFMLLLAVLFLWPQPSDAFKNNINSIMQSYLDGSYEKTVDLIEEELSKLKSQDHDNKKRIEGYIKQLAFIQAHIYAWKLNRTEKAINILENLQKQELRSKSQGLNKDINIYIKLAEINYQNNNTDKALENYKNSLSILENGLSEQHDKDLLFLFAGIMDYIKFNIDSLSLRKKSLNYTPLFSRIDVLELASSFSFMSLAMLADILAPQLQWEMQKNSKAGKPISEIIKDSPSDRSTMFVEYSLLVNSASAEINPQHEDAFFIFLKKYPETYFAISLRALFYRYYFESGQTQKAAVHLNALRGLARKRGVDLKEGPDKHFVSPKATWTYYRKALASGDVDNALECHMPGNTTYKEFFEAIGPEKVKKIGKEMADIEEVETDRFRAEYEILRDIKGTKYSYVVYFVNINGEWKIDRY